MPFEGDEEAATLSWKTRNGELTTVVPVDNVQIKMMLFDARLYSFGLT